MNKEKHYNIKQYNAEKSASHNDLVNLKEHMKNMHDNAKVYEDEKSMLTERIDDLQNECQKYKLALEKIESSNDTLQFTEKNLKERINKMLIEKEDLKDQKLD